MANEKNMNDFTPEDTQGIGEIIETSGVIDLASISNDTNDEAEYKPVNFKSSDAKKAEESINRYNEILKEKLSYIENNDNKAYADKRDQIISDITDYKKNLITKRGFTPEEADEAAMNRLNKVAEEANTEYMKNNPAVAEIRIAKTDEGKLVIPEEDKERVHKTKVIRLLEVEDQSLKHINITKKKRTSPFNAIRLNTCIMSKYTVPCLNTGDMCTFSGTTTYNLVSLYYDEKETMAQRLHKQVALIYDRFVSSTTRSKYDSNGQLIMTQEEFANWFNAADISVALFAIYVASSTEMITTNLPCSNPACVDKDADGKEESHRYDLTYNCKELIKYDDIYKPEYALFKEVYDGINACANDVEGMKKVQEKLKAHRYQSSFTKNYYDVQSPSCARALEFYDSVDLENANDAMQGYINIAMYIDQAYIYLGEEDGEEVWSEPVESAKDLITIVSAASDFEFELYRNKLIINKSFIYSFDLTGKCDRCGTPMNIPVDVAALIFLKAQGTGVVIE